MKCLKINNEFQGGMKLSDRTDLYKPILGNFVNGPVNVIPYI